MSIRHLVAGGVLLAFALPRGDREADRIGRPQIVAAFVFGGLLFVTGHGALAWAQQTVPAGVAALLVGTIPIWMALFDRVAFGRRLPGARVRRHRARLRGPAFLFDPFGDGSVDRLGALVIVVQRDVLGRRVALLARRAAAEGGRSSRPGSPRSAAGSCSPGTR